MPLNASPKMKQDNRVDKTHWEGVAARCMANVNPQRQTDSVPFNINYRLVGLGYAILGNKCVGMETPCNFPQRPVLLNFTGTHIDQQLTSQLKYKTRRVTDAKTSPTSVAPYLQSM